VSVQRFETVLQAEGPGVFIEVPLDVPTLFGRARPAIRGTIAGHPFRSTIAVYGARDDQVPERRRRGAVAAQAFEPTGLGDSERLRRAATVPPLALAHSVSAVTGSRRLRPSGVSEYSTLGGTSG
jgi:Domain of unknown function (DUF1905)